MTYIITIEIGGFRKVVFNTKNSMQAMNMMQNLADMFDESVSDECKITLETEGKLAKEDF